MKLIIDIQAAQTSGSKTRGIGRYSLALAKAMARQANQNETWVAANAAFADTIAPLRREFSDLIPGEQFVVWQSPSLLCATDKQDASSRVFAETIRESFFENLRPDFVHISSLFEGPVDSSVTSVGTFCDGSRTAITLYDLIPLVNQEKYLADPYYDRLYRRKLASLRRAGLWLAISEHSRREAVDWLDLPAEKIAIVYPAADNIFRPIRLPESEVKLILHRYGLSRPFVMYTGGLDQRKNIDGLISAYASLPQHMRKQHQLAIVCAARTEAIRALKNYGQKKGLGADDIVFTGFVPDDHLVALYNQCKAFCFPSLHEGFGLPVLEAMQCGAPTIGSHNSSIPEVIGCTDALFDPLKTSSIASSLKQVLTNDDFREKLAEHGLARSKKFSWDESAARAWTAFEEQHALAAPLPTTIFTPWRRPTLAYVSPFPPEKSGIADYSAELLPELARHYEIEAIVDQSEVTDKETIANCEIRDVTWFERNSQKYDRILYHFGNSLFHQHMFKLAARNPGVVVLHDFYLSGVLAHLEFHNEGHIWSESLYRSHGYPALLERARAREPHSVVNKYPANFPIIEASRGIIVHSEHARQLGQRFYGVDTARYWSVIPLARRLPVPTQPANTRADLGFNDDSFIVCSFGIMHPTKLNQRLVQAWTESTLGSSEKCHLVFVGEGGGAHQQELNNLIKSSPARDRLHITGFAPSDLYRDYLSIADIAVQLRTFSRGESSRSITDCLAYGIPTIANAHGSAAELPPDSVLMLPDDFSDSELSGALESLFLDPARRKSLGVNARKHTKNKLSPRLIADQYASAIEKFFQTGPVTLKRQIISRLAEAENQLSERDWLAVSRAIAHNLPNPRPQRQILIDVSSSLAQGGGPIGSTYDIPEILTLLTNPREGYRVEPVHLCQSEGKWHYRYARAYTLELLKLEGAPLNDEPVELSRGDIFFGSDESHRETIQASKGGIFEDLRRLDIALIFRAGSRAISDDEFREHVVPFADRIIFSSAEFARKMADWCEVHGGTRCKNLDIIIRDKEGTDWLTDILIPHGRPMESISGAI